LAPKVMEAVRDYFIRFETQKTTGQLHSDV